MKSKVSPCCQFRQHFIRRFLRQYSLDKKLQSQNVQEKSLAKHLLTSSKKLAVNVGEIYT